MYLETCAKFPRFLENCGRDLEGKESSGVDFDDGFELPAFKIRRNPVSKTVFEIFEGQSQN